MKNALLFLLLAFVISTTEAQPFSLDERVKPTELNLYEFNPPNQPKAKGRLNVTQVTQTKDTTYFFARNLSIYSPVYIGITTQNKDNPLEVRLCKTNWHTVSRSGSTGTEGHWEDRFKTEGDFGIMVIASNKPAEYSLIVWNGDEAKFDLPTIFSNDKSVTTAKGGEGFFKKNMLYIIIAALVLVVGILFFRLKNRKNENKTA